jgi:hypothetical protein
MVSPNDLTIKRSKLYQAYGFGVIIKNELLVIKTFQFAIGFYPNLPNDAAPFRFNPVKTYDFQFDDFQIQQPYIIPFQ